ncbi:hypothetical protein [Agrobacterium tumefaciens]|uniref:hypothetical protein n=1 Tax=Agrobacterium tumefaciens TaxID=358 RepID=UPI001572BF65|nr:hypothetical protein [Agrobacterium tumefaciens]
MSQSEISKSPGYESTAEYNASPGISVPTPSNVDTIAVHLSDDEILTVLAESEIRFFHDRRRDQELMDTLFSEEKPTDGMIVFARHASECVQSATDRELTKQVLHFMGPIAYQPSISPELLDTVHTMMLDVYFWGRERLLAQAYDMGAGVKV